MLIKWFNDYLHDPYSARYVSWKTLNTLEALLDSTKFVRIHRSAIVQISRIKELQTLPNRELRLLLIDGTDLRVSRTYRERLDRWLSR